MPRGVKTSRSVNKAASGGSNRELKIRDDDQRYAIVTKLLGNNRVMVNLGKTGPRANGEAPSEEACVAVNGSAQIALFCLLCANWPAIRTISSPSTLMMR